MNTSDVHNAAMDRLVATHGRGKHMILWAGPSITVSGLWAASVSTHDGPYQGAEADSLEEALRKLIP